MNHLQSQEATGMSLDAPPQPKEDSSVVKIAKQRAKQNASNASKEIQKICLEIEDARWNDPQGKTLRDSTDALMRQFDKTVRLIQKGRKPNHETIRENVRALTATILCLPGMRLRGTSQRLLKLDTSIRNPTPRQGESSPECILREVAEQGKVISAVFWVENVPLAQKKQDFAKATAAAQSELTKFAKENSLSID